MNQRSRSKAKGGGTRAGEKETGAVELARRLLRDQEADRRRIAAALHDEVVQMLAAVKLNLGAPQFEPEDESARELYRETRALLGEAVDRTRELTLELWPTALDDLGLKSTLKWYLTRLAEENGWQASLETGGGLEGLDADTVSACFHVIREALTNVAAHGGAERVRVSLQCQDGALRLEIRDDGRGFDAKGQPRASARAQRGLGLMRDRFRALGGKLDVHSGPGEGTRISGTMPVRAGGQSLGRSARDG